MSKHNFLRRIALLCLVVVQGALGFQALAGSIVINNPPQPQPKKADEGRNSSGFIAPESSQYDELLTHAVQDWLSRNSENNVESYSYATSETGNSVSVSWQSDDTLYSQSVPLDQLLSIRE
ncbi:MAG: hypothetical protein RIR26_2226 [Pseudomonadota bacterium]